MLNTLVPSTSTVTIDPITRPGSRLTRRRFLPRLILLELPIGLRLRYDVTQEFQIVDPGDGRGDVLVRDVAAGFR